LQKAELADWDRSSFLFSLADRLRSYGNKQRRNHKQHEGSRAKKPTTPAAHKRV
jgi:hypothetical protein